MTRKQSTTGSNPSDKFNLRCPYCKTQLPSQAVFCSYCGKSVKKIGDWEIRAEDGEGDAQETDVDTVRMAPLSQTHLKRWQAFRSLKNTKAPEQPHLNGPLLQDAEAPMSSLLETEIPKTEPVDARTQREAPIPIELLQSLPTTPVTSISETWQQVPDTEVPASNPPVSNRLWPTIIILSAVAAGLVNFVFTDIAIRPAIMFWFLAVCPGMALVRFLRLADRVVEWILAIALSFAVDAMVAGILLYAGRWSPTATLGILMGISLGGAIMQTEFPVFLQRLSQGVRSRIAFSRKLSLVFVVLASLLSLVIRLGGAIKQRGYSVSLQTLAHGVKPRIAFSRKLSLTFVVLTLLLSLGIGADSLPHARSLPIAHSTTPAPTVVRSTPKPAPTATSVSSIYPALAGTYNGTIFDIPVNVKTSLTLTNVRESQGKISGYMTVGPGLLGYGPFSGTIDSTTKHLQFTVTDSDGNPTLFFEGAMQSATNLSGDYYRCNPAPVNPCNHGPAGYGIWNVLSSSPISTIYPTLAGMYNGTIFDVTRNVSTTITLTGIRQSQGSFSGFLLLGPKLQGSGPISGTIDTAKNLQFIVMDAAGNATLFFEGVMQSATSLSGDYYQCLPAPPQRGQCSKTPGSYGIWNVVLG
jgi:hypothetical protein